MSEVDKPKRPGIGGLCPSLRDGGRNECSKVGRWWDLGLIRWALLCMCVFFLLFTHTHTPLSPQPASQTPCPFSENTTCVTKAANLLSTAVSPVWGEKHFLSPSQSPLWSHSNPLSHHSTKINHYTVIGPLLCSVSALWHYVVASQQRTNPLQRLINCKINLHVKIANRCWL